MCEQTIDFHIYFVHLFLFWSKIRFQGINDQYHLEMPLQCNMNSINHFVCSVFCHFFVAVTVAENQLNGIGRMNE